VVAAVDPTLPPPLGPFLPGGVKSLGDNEIVLVNWKGTPLPPGQGIDQVRLTYYEADLHDKPRTVAMKVRGWIELAGAADDPDLTPEFPGITDQPSIDQWDPPPGLHYDNKRVTQADRDFWNAYRTTPKAYVNLATGQKLWGSRFGQFTSIRLAPTAKGAEGSPPDLGKATKEFEANLRKNLQPEQAGLVFDTARTRIPETGGTDFGALFLSFSVFIIAAALLLVGLLFRLNLDRRASEVGLLLATGVRRSTIRGLFLAEGSLLAVLGGLVGSAGAVGYAWLLLEYLRAWWPGGLEESFLHLDVTAGSFLLGFAAALLVSVLTIAWAARVLGRVSPRALLAGETTEAVDFPSARRAPRWRRWVGGLALVGGLACLAAGNFVHDPEMQASTFFGSGLLLLVAGLVGVWSFLKRDSTVPSRHVATLGVRNASRHPVRSLLTVGLLASASFLVIAVESFHRDPGRDFSEQSGGSGGFALLADSDVPSILDLRSQEGKDDLDLQLKQAQATPGERELVQKSTFYPFRLRAGDDASCLNLAQPRRPRLLGVPHAFIERGGFRFQASEAASSAEVAKPWLLLEEKRADGAVPVIGDATTVTWMLKSGLGKELVVPDGGGRPVRLRLVALLEDSIFQSELLLSDANFRRLYPHQQGYNYFLIDPPAGHAADVKGVLENALANQGFTVTPTLQRVEAYLAVENTYLATFQALGGLGLLLGALGLAVVLLRSVWERRGELALLRALGYRRSALGWLVLAENGFLLAVGLAVGAVTALAAVAPHVWAGAGEVPWLRLLGLLALVLVVGLAAGAAAVATALRAPLVPALRRE
jgi:ABC-type antimicrobial peptide transport system permease subunit